MGVPVTILMSPKLPEDGIWGLLGVEQNEWPSLVLALMSVGINELPKFKLGCDLPW